MAEISEHGDVLDVGIATKEVVAVACLVVRSRKPVTRDFTASYSRLTTC